MPNEVSSQPPAQTSFEGTNSGVLCISQSTTGSPTHSHIPSVSPRHSCKNFTPCGQRSEGEGSQPWSIQNRMALLPTPVLGILQVHPHTAPQPPWGVNKEGVLMRVLCLDTTLKLAPGQIIQTLATLASFSVENYKEHSFPSV